MLGNFTMQKLTLMMLVMLATNAFATESPCEVELLKSQGQISKATNIGSQQKLEALFSSPSVSLPQVQAKADVMVNKTAVIEVPTETQKNEWESQEEEDKPASGSTLGTLFELLIPAKLRNPAR